VKSPPAVATHLAFFQGTPTVLVNGKKIDSPTSKAIEAAVAAARK
jgi:protein-disulfide isomerase